MRRRLCDLDPYLAPPFREQYTPAQEARMEAEEREQERLEDLYVGALRGEVPWHGLDFGDALMVLGRLATTDQMHGEHP